MMFLIMLAILLASFALKAYDGGASGSEEQKRFQAVGSSRARPPARLGEIIAPWLRRGFAVEFGELVVTTGTRDDFRQR
jgi:hypothetical protein